jgi:hypothetical protein
VDAHQLLISHRLVQPALDVDSEGLLLETDGLALVVLLESGRHLRRDFSPAVAEEVLSFKATGADAASPAAI